MRSFKKTKLSNRDLWDRKANEWHVQVQDSGDRNRRFNSDPVLWRFLGSIEGCKVLDAGCGTGYLARQLAAKGAHVVGIDFSTKMIELARTLTVERGLEVDYRIDSCATMATIADASIDKLISNYVLQDFPELAEAAHSFHRVLRNDGIASLVFTHPCFPQSDETDLQPDGSVTYRWQMAYFEEHEVEEEPWSHFTSPFVSYHRPLSAYWRAFKDAGFDVIDFDEPVVAEPPPPDYDRISLRRSRMRPNSVAFLLRKPG